MSSCAIGVTIAYTYYERLKLLLAEHEAEIEQEEFAADVTVYARLPVNHFAELEEAVLNLTSGAAAPIVLDEAPG